MLIDCFPYFNERELLELRVSLLKDHVDGFLIADADRTHRGEPKAFTCAETIKELGLPDELIEVIHVKLPTVDEEPDHWVRERGQRDALGIYLSEMPKNAVFICSDCDELPNPAKFEQIKSELEANPDAILGLDMSMHYGRADLQLCTPLGELFHWHCATICTAGKLASLGSITNVRRQTTRKVIGDRDAGWHLSWMGDSERRLKKLKSYAHWETDMPTVVETCKTFEAVAGSIDMLGREDHMLTAFPMEDLPLEAVTLERVRQYLLPNG